MSKFRSDSSSPTGGNDPSSPQSKGNRSPIWQYFEPVDTKNTKCLLCKSTYRNSGNTTNLIDHLKRKHRQEYQHISELMKNQSANNDKNNNNDDEDTELPDTIQVINEKPELLSESEHLPINEQIEEHQVNSTEDNIEIIEVDEESVRQQLGNDEYLHAQIVKVVPLPHARSEVWKYFGFVASEDGNILDRHKVVCKLCTSTFCYSGNTTNFYSHLKSMHSEVHMRSLSGKSHIKYSGKRSYSTLMDGDSDSDIKAGDTTNSNGSFTLSNKSNRTSSTTDQNKFNNSVGKEKATIGEGCQDDLIYVDDITDCIIDFLVTDCRPLCIVQGEGFQKMLRLLAPGYVLPDKKRLADDLRKRLELMKHQRETTSMDRFHDFI